MAQTKPIPHTAKKDGIKRITIIHPYHPDKGKSYEYQGLSKFEYGDYVMCVDEQGRIRFIPVDFTDVFCTSEGVNGKNCVMTIDNLLSLIEFIADILPANYM